jgi:hypothetical protein
MIQGKEGSVFSQQALSFQAEVLSNEATLEACHISNGSVLELVVLSTFSIEIGFEDVFDGNFQQIELTVMATTTVEELKAMIQSKNKLSPERLHLYKWLDHNRDYHEECELEDDMTLGECDIDASTELLVCYVDEPDEEEDEEDEEAHPVPSDEEDSMMVKINQIGGDTITMNINVNTSVLSLKMMLSKMVHVHREQLKLVFQEEIMENDRLVSQYSYHETELTLIKQPSIQVKVRFDANSPHDFIVLQMSPNATVEDVKLKVQEHQEDWTDDFKINIMSREDPEDEDSEYVPLETPRELQSYGIEDGSTLWAFWEGDEPGDDDEDSDDDDDDE